MPPAAALSRSRRSPTVGGATRGLCARPAGVFTVHVPLVALAAMKTASDRSSAAIAAVHQPPMNRRSVEATDTLQLRFRVSPINGWPRLVVSLSLSLSLCVFVCLS